MSDGQLAFDDMPQQLLRATPTRLANFDCPRRYRLTYLERPPLPGGGPWAHNTLGATVHVALARFWDEPVARRTPEVGADLVGQAWQRDGFRDDDQAATWRARAAGWVRDYLDRALHGDPRTPPLDAAAAPVGVERTVATHTDSLALSGRLDRLDDRDGELVVVDYKSGRHVPTAADAAASPALALYAVATARTLRRACATVELHHLPSGTVARAEHTATSTAEHVARADARARAILAATGRLHGGADPDVTFPAVTGPGCTWCDVRRHCPEGRRAAPEARSWDGLADVVG